MPKLELGRIIACNLGISLVLGAIAMLISDENEVIIIFVIVAGIIAGTGAIGLWMLISKWSGYPVKFTK